MAWRLAKSLQTLRTEVNALAPNRSKLSDGTIGNAEHSDRPSRHNPNNAGVVCAWDVTHDPAKGCDVHTIVGHILNHPPEALEYIIWQGRIAKRRNGFAWERYYGANAHNVHAHIAVGRGPDSEPTPPYDSTAPWGIAAPPPPPPSEEDDMTPAQEAKLDAIHMLVTAAAQDSNRALKLAEEIAERQVPEATVREDIVLTREIAKKVGVTP